MENSLHQEGVPHPEEIKTARLAYRLWEKAGRPTGRFLEFLILAEQHATAIGDSPEVKSVPAGLPATVSSQNLLAGAKRFGGASP